MIIWVETDTDELTSITDMRQLRIREVNIDIDGETVSRKNPNITETYYAVEVLFPATAEYQDRERLARYSERGLAKTYQRYLGMSINAAVHNREPFLIIPYMNEEACVKMQEQFKQWDKEKREKREAEAAAKAAAAQATASRPDGDAWNTAI